MANLLITLGAALLGTGLLLKLLPAGKLPGDILLQKGNLTVFFPVVTCIVLSVVLTIALNIFRR